MDNSKTVLLPEQGSTFSHFIDPLFYGYTYAALLLLAIITFTVVYLAFKYRRKSPDQKAKAQITHNLKLEIIWTVTPLIVFMILFVLGWKGFIHMSIAPSDSLQINVIGQKWNWNFKYPNGATTDTLVIPKNTNIRLIMNSRDVLHSFYIPAFRTKKDVIPNYYSTLWFNANKEGTYHVFCAEYCGTNHSNMTTGVKVLNTEDYYNWYKEATKGPQGTPEEIGAILYKKKGCNACHSIEGKRLVGPPWNNLFGSEKIFTDGSKGKADENYLRSSIVEPQKKIVEGYPPVMPTYRGQLTDENIDAIIAYIKSIN